MSKNLLNGKTIIIVTLVLVLIGIGLILFGGKNGGSLMGKTVTRVAPIDNITLTATGFSPASITVKKNDVIIWANQSGKEASINSDDHPTHKLYPMLNLGMVANGSTVQVMLDKAGTYTYHNHLNPQEKGTIIVQ